MVDTKKVIELFKGNELVKFSIPNLGEIEFKTIEFAYMIKKLEKQIPKTPTMTQFYDIMTQKIIHEAKCPGCGEKLVIIEFLAEKERIYKENSSYNYCCNCGQAISWEVDK